MDTLEINKIVGAVCGALLIYLGTQAVAEIFFHHGEHDYAYALDISEDGTEDESPVMDVAALIEGADVARGERVFGKCKACHKVDGTNATGPHLDGVVGRDVSSVDGFAYSGSLKPAADVWSTDNLFHFLENPRKFAPGTAMGFAGLRKAEDRAAVIAYLGSLHGGE